MQNDPVASKALQLLRLGMMPTLAELKERGLVRLLRVLRFKFD